MVMVGGGGGRWEETTEEFSLSRDEKGGSPSLALYPP